MGENKPKPPEFYEQTLFYCIRKVLLFGDLLSLKSLICSMLLALIQNNVFSIAMLSLDHEVQKQL